MRLTGKSAAAMACVCAMGIAACGDDGGSSGGSSGGGDKQYSVSFIVGQKGPAFYTNMLCGASNAAEKLGVKLSTAGAPEWGPAQQLPLINSSLAKNPDALIVVPTDPKGLNPVLKRAKADGVKVFTADTQLESGSGIETAALTSAGEEGGKQAADALAKLIGDKGTVVPISNPPGISTSAARLKGFLVQMEAAHPNIKVLKTQYNDTTPQKSASLVTSSLSANPDITGVFATDDVGVIGSGTALRNAKKTDGISLVGFDADPTLIKALESGAADALIAQRPDVQGQKAVEEAVAALKGDKVAALTQTPHVVITRDNLNSPASQEAAYKETCSG